MIQRLSFLLLCLLALPLCIMAQREEKVEAEYTYVVPENLTLEQARRTALERAQIQAIADEFGTLVSQSNTTFVANKDGESSIAFFSLGGSDVRGEWIETTGGPDYEQGFTDEGQMWVKCTVKGRIREIVSAQIDLVAKVLRNGTEEKFEGCDFRSGDDMYVWFKSPQDGFLAVYLIDETAETAYCLLPYSQSDDAVQVIRHDQPYIFFSPKHAPAEQKNIVDELTMTCSRDMERNDLYIIYSPHQFAKANSIQTAELLPRELPWEEFNRWLVKQRKHDKEMTVQKIMLTIKKINTL